MNNDLSLKNNKILLAKLSNALRILTVDAVEKANSGHPGMPLGIADVFTCLVFGFLRFKPDEPKWHFRDRLVLSAGHGSMLLYAFYYLAGYKDYTLEQLQKFRQIDSLTPGHPERGTHEPVETTTGPLGQGLANAVGMAIAAKKKHQNHHIYCIVGDGCLMEGISYEAISLAGHLKLDNLTIIFDSNNITIDGPTNLSISEQQGQKFQAFGFEVFEVNGHDYQNIWAKLELIKNCQKPTIIIAHTQIGYGSPNKAGFASSHGAPLGPSEVLALRHQLNWPETQPFIIPEDLLQEWRNAWQLNYLPTASTAALQDTPPDFQALISLKPTSPEATRVSSGKVVSHLLSSGANVIIGSADLAGSNNLLSNMNKPITANNFSGNFLYYGVREHAMAAIMNGLACENIRTIGGTFLVFSDYMRPAIRLAAIMRLPIIYVMTHDSIGVGEDGPTHQPVEHLASLRAMPNLLVLRPADFTEVLESWQIAWERQDGPTMLILSRQNLPQLRHEISQENLASKGAYILQDVLDPQITIFASGSETNIAVKVAMLLKNYVNARIVSVVSFELFAQQNSEYRQELLGSSKLNVAIEAASSFGWHSIIGREGLFFGVNDFGISAPGKDVYNFFKLTPEAIAEKVKHAWRKIN